MTFRAPHRLLPMLTLGIVALLGGGSGVADAAWNDTSQNAGNSVTAATLAAPTGATASAPFDCATASVSWTAATGATTYRIERTLDDGSTWTIVTAGSGAVTTFTDSTSLPSSFTARYRVMARLAGTAWQSAASTTTSVRCARAADLVATHASGTTTLGWSAATAASGYDIERSIGTGGWNRVASNRAGTSYVDSSTFTGGDTVNYRVRAVSTAGVRSATWSNVATITWQPVPQPIDVARTITSDWVGGYCADVRVTNRGSKSVKWQVTLAMDAYPWAGTVTQSSSVTTVSTSSTSWTVKGVSWNQSLQPGESTTWDYCATRPTPPAMTVGVSNTRITSEWSTGYCASATVTSAATEPVAWRATLTPSTAPFTTMGWSTAAPSSSSVTTLTYGPSAWTFDGVGWNDILTPGQARDIAWCGTKAS